MPYIGYATPDYYKNVYKGNLIPDSDLEKALRKASRHIDSLTFNRIAGKGFDALTGHQQEIIQEVVCQQAEFEVENADAIDSVLQRLVPEGMRPADTTGLSLKQLAREYVKNGTPVLVWATVDMQPAAEGAQWLVPSTGELFTWPRGEHCLLLTGYDRFYYYFNDPYENRGRIAYPKEQVNARFTELGSKSAAIIKK